MSEQEQLNQFWNREALIGQAKGMSSSLDDGYYDVALVKATPAFDKGGVACVKGEFDVLAPESAKGRKHFENFRFGNEDDPKADLPETQLESMGMKLARSICEVTETPANNRLFATLFGDLLNKPFTARIDAKPNKKTGEKYTNIRRVMPLHKVPARIDGQAIAAAATTGTNGSTPASGPMVGVEFAAE